MGRWARGWDLATQSWSVVQNDHTLLAFPIVEAGGQILSAIFGGLANLAWAVATSFVIPVLALESLGRMEAIKRSSSVVRQR
jgi:Family of unknown function (DUF6159)